MRTVLYLTALAVTITTFSLSLSALIQPNWIISQTPRSSPVSLTTTYGLFQRCDSSSWTDDVTCRRFPARGQDCQGSLGGRFVREGEEVGGAVGVEGEVGTEEKRKRLGKKEDEDEWGFCDSWITAGYAAQLSLAFGGSSILASLLVLLGGRTKRESGWRIVSGLISLHAGCLILAVALVAHEFNSDDRFFFGSRLDKSFVMATTAWSLDVLLVGALVLLGVSGLVREDDYSRIEE